MISDKERDALKAAAHAGRERAPQLPVDNSELLLAAERAGALGKQRTGDQLPDNRIATANFRPTGKFGADPPRAHRST